MLSSKSLCKALLITQFALLLPDRALAQTSDCFGADAAVAAPACEAMLAGDDPGAAAEEAASRSLERAESAETADSGLQIAQAQTGAATSEPAEPQVAPSDGTAGASDIELIFWNDVKDSRNPEELEVFLQAFPDSVFAPLARLRLKALAGSDDAQRATAAGTGTEAQPAQEAATAPEPIALSPVPEFEIIGDSGNESVALVALELPRGDFLVGGSQTPGGKDDERPWIALYRNGGEKIWDAVLPVTAEYGYVSGVAALGPDRIVVAMLQLTDWDKPAQGNLLAFDLEGNPVWSLPVDNVAPSSSFVALSRMPGGDLLVATPVALPGENLAGSRVMRVDAGGKLVWEQVFDGKGEDFAAFAAASSDAVFAVGGSQAGQGEPLRPWLRKLTPSGKVIWERRLNDADDAFYTDLVPQADGGAIVLGVTDSAGDRGNWISRYDGDGNQLWQQEFRIGLRDTAYQMVGLANGEIAVAGSGGSREYGDGSVGWLIWFDRNGNELDRRLLGDHPAEQYWDVSETHDGMLVLAGQIGNAAGADAGDLAHVWVVPSRAGTAPALMGGESEALLRACLYWQADPLDTQLPFDDLAFLLPDQIDTEQARRDCRLAQAIMPKNMHTNYAMGLVEQAAGSYDSALIYFLEAGRLGHARALLQAGLIYMDDPDGLGSERRAVETLEQSMAIHADPLAAWMLGILYRDGRGVARDDGKAVAYLRIGAEDGIRDAQFLLGQHYANGRGVTRDDRTAVSWYRKSAEQDYPEALRELAYHLQWGIGVSQDQYEAISLYLKASDLGNATAKFDIATAYRTGDRGLGQNDAASLFWYEQAAAAGHLSAFENAGYMYQFGIGTDTVDLGKALSFYRQGVEKGSTGSHYYLGRMYENGTGVTQDLAEAVRLYRIAIDGDYSLAMSAMGYMYRDGRGVPENDEKAYGLFQRASNLNDTEGDREAGWMKYSGEGTAKDLIGGIVQIEKAAKARDGLALVYLGWIYEVEERVYDSEKAARYYYDGLTQGEDWPTTREIKDWDRAVAKALQRKLKSAGHYKGAIDGLMGPGSLRAMKALCGCG